MKRALLVLMTCLFTVTWAGPASAQSPAEKPAKGFFSHPLDTRGQGNMGVPDMRDPYGHDKESNRFEETGNRGRPIRGTVPEPEPTPEPILEPEPEPIPEPTPEPTPDPEPTPEPEPTPDPIPVPEPEPEPTPEPEPVPEPEPRPLADLDMVFGYAGFLPGWHFYASGPAPQFYKSVQWVPWSDERVVAMNHYEQRPGETDYHLNMTFDLAALKEEYQQNGAQGFYQQMIDGPYGQWWLSFSPGWISYADYRTPADWELGVYRHYVTPVDQYGNEGPRSVIMTCVNLGETQILIPQDGGVVTSLSAIQWEEVFEAFLSQGSYYSEGSYSSSVVVVWEPYDDPNSSVTYRPLWTKYVAFGTTSVLYDGPALTPGKTYYITVGIIFTMKDAALPPEDSGLWLTTYATPVRIVVE